MATVGIPHPPPGPPPPLPRRFIRRRFIKPLDTRPAPVPGLWQPKDSKPNKPPKLGTDTKHTAKSRARATFLGGERAKFDARFPPLGKDTDPARADVGKTTPEQPNFEERVCKSMYNYTCTLVNHVCTFCVTSWAKVCMIVSRTQICPEVGGEASMCTVISIPSRGGVGGGGGGSSTPSGSIKIAPRVSVTYIGT